MSYSDIYEAIDRGPIEGVDMSMMRSQTFKHYEIVKWLFMTNSGGVIASGIYMNLKVFQKFPKDMQEMFLKLRTEYGERYGKGIMDLESGFYREWTTKHGVPLKNPSPEDQKIILDSRRAWAGHDL